MRNWTYLPLVLSSTSLVIVAASALVKTYSPYTNDPIIINVQSTNLLDGFYDCLKLKAYHSCKLHLTRQNNWIYNAVSLTSENVVNIYDYSSYYCKFQLLWQQYYFICEKSYLKCFNSVLCDPPLFTIRWSKSDEYIEDENLQHCSSNLNFCTSYIKRINTFPSTLSIINSASSTRWTNDNTVKYTVSAIVNYSTTVIPNTTLLENKQPSDTKIIIAGVVVGVCLLFGIGIVVYCFRKRLLTKKTKSSKTCALIGKRKSNTLSMIDVPSTKTLDNAADSSYATYGHAYDLYELNCIPQVACSAQSTSSDTYHTSDQIPNMSYSNVSTTARPVKAVYQNAKVENKNVAQIKDYDRLGDHVREFKNDYNCLCPEGEANQLEVSKDLQTIQLKDLDLTEYSLAHQWHEAIDEEPSTPYTLAQIIKT
ncbi:uncharacterized protein LOC129921695 [Biomphalaria glabrata]|uniref:Uncharacterized protein LOC129921695 n=1 Tax=Biomphalaria glabrata TaxID=6526 RepID=A0A9W2YBN0_BIOGL|nr:uncharacterized protein LOC129921695 [Biomphalaria glabrata]